MERDYFMRNDYMLSVVVPVYNEENGINPFLDRMESALEQLGCEYEIIFCLDPSTDNTEAVIRDNMRRNRSIKLMTFSRRFRQAAATMAGVLNCKGDACMVIDVDLQDPPELVIDFVEKWQEGYDVVYGQRIDRQGETKFHLIWAATAYRVIHFLSKIDIPVDTSDFRLIDRRVIEELRRMPESNMFFRGMVSYVGFKQTAVRFHREAREADVSKYNKFWGDLRMGLHGIICFSSKPLEYVTIAGIFLTAFGACMSGLYAISKGLFRKKKPFISGTAALIWLFGGIQVLISGLLGEYITRIYDDVTGRPRFIIDEFDENE